MNDPVFWTGVVLGGGVSAIIFTIVSYYVIREERRTLEREREEMEGYNV